MSEDLRLTLVTALGVIILAVGYYLIILRRDKKRQKFFDKANKNNCTAVANLSKVTAILKKTKNIDYEKVEYLKIVVVKYEYTVNDRKYYKKYIYRARGANNSATYPDKIFVYYDEKRPQKAKTKGEDNSLKPAIGCLGTFVIACGVMLAFEKILIAIFG